MPKELITNVHSMFSKADSVSKTLLYDAKKNGLLSTIGQVASLTDSIDNYDAIVVECLLHLPSQNYYDFSEFTIYSKYLYRSEPITDSLNDVNNIYNAMMYMNNRLHRVCFAFPNDKTIKLVHFDESDNIKSRVRNIYGINFGSKDSYTINPIVTGEWVDGKPIYRQVVEFGVHNWTKTDTFVALPHGLSIDSIVDYSLMLYNTDHTHLRLPYVNGDISVGCTIDALNVIITNNTDVLGMNLRLIIEYTKL